MGVGARDGLTGVGLFFIVFFCLLFFPKLIVFLPFFSTVLYFFNFLSGRPCHFRPLYKSREYLKIADK